MESKIPGIKALHAVVSTTCRENRGDEGACNEALARLKAEYESLIKHWTPEKGAKFHFVLTIEYQSQDHGRIVPKHGSGP